MERTLSRQEMNSQMEMKDQRLPVMATKSQDEEIRRAAEREGSKVGPFMLSAVLRYIREGK